MWSIQTGSHPVGMGGSLGARFRGSVTVGFLILKGASIDFCLSFASDAPSKVHTVSVVLVLFDDLCERVRVERLEAFVGYLGIDFHSDLFSY